MKCICIVKRQDMGLLKAASLSVHGEVRQDYWEMPAVWLGAVVMVKRADVKVIKAVCRDFVTASDFHGDERQYLRNLLGDLAIEDIDRTLAKVHDPYVRM